MVKQLPFHPTDWHILNKAPIELLVTGPNNPNAQPRIVQSIQDTPLFTIDNLNVQDAGAMLKNLEIHMTLSQLSTNSTVIIIWMVSKDNRVIGQYVQKFSGPQLGVGRETIHGHSYLKNLDNLISLLAFC